MLLCAVCVTVCNISVLVKQYSPKCHSLCRQLRLFPVYDIIYPSDVLMIISFSPPARRTPSPVTELSSTLSIYFPQETAARSGYAASCWANECPVSNKHLWRRLTARYSVTEVFYKGSSSSKRSWMSKRPKSKATGAPLSHRKHCSWNTSSVVLPLIPWLCDIAVTMFTIRPFGRHFCMKRLTLTRTLMAVAAMQGANQHIRSSLGFSTLPKDTSTCRPGESNQRPSDNN